LTVKDKDSGQWSVKAKTKDKAKSKNQKPKTKQFLERGTEDKERTKKGQREDRNYRQMTLNARAPNHNHRPIES